MTEENLPEEIPGDHSENNGQESEIIPGKRRRRRVRKRIRIKKKPSAKKKIKKYLERLLWLVVISGFIATLVIWMKAMEIKDDRSQAKKPKKSSMIKVKIYPRINMDFTGKNT